MGQMHWSVDERQYDDRDSHTLILSGWFADPEKKDFTFALYGDGRLAQELPKPQRFERPDVAREFPEFKTPGFILKVPDALQLGEKYSLLEIFLVHGEEKYSIWKSTGEELEAFCAEQLIEYHMDREELLYGTALALEGWVLSQRGSDEIRVEDERGIPLKCQFSRGRRPDVMESRRLSADFRDREIGFRVSVNLRDLGGKCVVLHFCGEGTERTHTVNVKKLRAESSVFHRRLQVLSWENRDRNRDYIRKNGVRKFVRYVDRAGSDASRGDYDVWFRSHQANHAQLRRQRQTVFDNSPLISIVIPLYNTPVPYLEEVLSSIKKQTYANWQLCLADGSDNDEVRTYLKKKYHHEKRISYKKLRENKGISQNTNAALDMAVGDYIMLCDHDDVVAPDALFEIVTAINRDYPDVLYTDEDKVSMDGKRYFEPNFKPNFNLFRLRENNYICHIFVARRAVLLETGFFREEFDGAQDFDLILRCCEKAGKITHIPKPLYHWRSHMASTAADPASKAYAYEAGRRAVEEHYRRLGIQARVEATERPGWYRSHVEIVDRPLISIIIPNRDHIEDLELCLSSMDEKSTYENYEILIAENNSGLPETFAYYEALPEKHPKARVLTWTKEFNYSAINNFAAQQAKGEYLLFLNNDVEIITPEWMEEMLQICQQEQVGIVGAKLYYPDDTIQHAGVVLGLGGIAGHIMCRALRSDEGYMGRMVSVQEISAVTAACMLVKTSVFQAVEGFDEAFQVAFNDIDLCMKVGNMGKKTVFTPYAELYHYESKSRGLEDTPEKQFRFSKEVRRFESKWLLELSKGDPYYSPNLSVKEGDCSLSED